LVGDVEAELGDGLLVDDDAVVLAGLGELVGDGELVLLALSEVAPFDELIDVLFVVGVAVHGESRIEFGCLLVLPIDRGKHLLHVGLVADGHELLHGDLGPLDVQLRVVGGRIGGDVIAPTVLLKACVVGPILMVQTIYEHYHIGLVVGFGLDQTVHSVLKEVDLLGVVLDVGLGVAEGVGGPGDQGGVAHAFELLLVGGGLLMALVLGEGGLVIVGDTSEGLRPFGVSLLDVLEVLLREGVQVLEDVALVGVVVEVLVGQLRVDSLHLRVPSLLLALRILRKPIHTRLVHHILVVYLSV